MGGRSATAKRSTRRDGARVDDDVATRKAALAAGADRVHPYRRLFEDGPRQLAAWLAGDRTVEPPT